MTTASVVLALFVLSACASPPTTMRDSQSPAIGISLIVKPPIGLFRYRPDTVYFVTAEREEALSTQGLLVESNYIKGDRAYLLNATPGRYIAVAAYYSTNPCQLTPHYTTFFSQEVVTRTEVSADPGTIAFMGDYVVNQSMDLTNPDDAQIRFIPRIDPNAFRGLGGTKEEIVKAVVTAAITAALTREGRMYYSGLLGEGHRDRRAEETFLKKALDDLREGGWAGIIQQRIDALRSAQ